MAGLINFLTGIARERHHYRVRYSPWTTFFNGVSPPKSRRPLPSERDQYNEAPPEFLFLRAGSLCLRGFFNMSFSIRSRRFSVSSS